MPQNTNLATSFDFPKFLTVGQYTAYQRAVTAALAKLKDRNDATGNEALAVIFCAARDAGILQNWHSLLMPKLNADDINEQHAFVIIWVAEQVHEWIEGQRNVDPKSLWRRLIALTETARRLLSWLSRGVASVSAVSQKRAG